MSAGPGATPTAIQLQYTRGTGPSYPTDLQPTVATQSGLQSAALSVNGYTGAIILEAGTQSGGTLTITEKPNTPGTLQFGLNVPTFTVPLVTSLPGSPDDGELVFNTVTSHLALWNGTAWVSVLLS